MSSFGWDGVLETLRAGKDLTADEAQGAMRAMMSGDGTPEQVGGFLLALRAKSETPEEVAAMATVMRDLSLKVKTDLEVVDTCGTGGDGSGSVNLSTMAALVVAAAGVPVAKHGNRAASSKCGSADVLEALGVAIDLDPDGVAACIVEAGIGFCFAPRFHPAMRFVGPIRRELGVPTTFNILGPLTNPAGARRQVIGVASADLADLVAHALAELGTEHALVVHGADGLDEITAAGESKTWTVKAGHVLEGTFDPADFGIPRSPTSDLAGGDAEANAAAVRRLLDGEQGSIRDAVVLNAGAAIFVADAAADIADGIDMAISAIDRGAAARTLEAFIAVSNAQAS